MPKTPLSIDQTPKRSLRSFLAKYLLEGQNHDPLVQPTRDPSWVGRHRNLLAFLLPFVFFQVGWWSLAVRHDLFRLYPTRYQMPLTMIVGAFVSGCTSEGGGAVAFPVMTLLLELEPRIARDFSLMIQSCGMAASSFTVIWMGVKVEWRSILLCSLGAFFSVILGLQFGDHLLTGGEKKMIFVSVWFAFAVSLFVLNRQHKRQTFDRIPDFRPWKGLVLLVTGIVGGLLTAMTGSGVDICSFCVLTLLFRVSEKVATPTSVVLMWVNTWVGFYWRQLIMSTISPLAWEYFSVSVPVVVTCSPLGALVASVLHRQTLAFMVYVLESLAVVGFLLTRPPLVLILVGCLIVLVASTIFVALSRTGELISRPLAGSHESPSNSADLTPDSRILFAVG